MHTTMSGEQLGEGKPDPECAAFAGCTLSSDTSAKLIH
jgi:hypothetical protein